MADARLDDFLPHVGQTFTLSVADISLPATLTGAEALPGSMRDGGGFRLEFVGPAEPVLAQAIMAVSGPAGEQEIFLVPIARDAGGARYEAVFY